MLLRKDFNSIVLDNSKLDVPELLEKLRNFDKQTSSIIANVLIIDLSLTAFSRPILTMVVSVVDLCKVKFEQSLEPNEN